MRQKFFQALNGIFGKVGTKTQPNVLINLIDSFCLPVLTLYVEALKLHNLDYNMLESAYTIAFAKIFGSNNTERQLVLANSIAVRYQFISVLMQQN